MATYFGQQTYSSNNTTGVGQYKCYKNVTHACPGAGAQEIVTLECYAKYNSGSGNIRLAIYTTGLDLVVESTNVKALGAAYAWMIWTAGELTWRNGHTTLIGGISYKLAYWVDNVAVIGYTSGSSGDMVYKTYEDYSAGMPDPGLSLGIDNSSYLDMIRCGVDAAAAAAAPTSVLRGPLFGPMGGPI